MGENCKISITIIKDKARKVKKKYLLFMEGVTRVKFFDNKKCSGDEIAERIAMHRRSRMVVSATTC